MLQFHPDVVSQINKCQTSEARRIVIYNLLLKVISNVRHIGGTYTKDVPDLWFYYSLSACSEGNFLLSLFACHRSAGVFSIGISKASEFTQKSDSLQSLYLSEILTWQTYVSAKANENHYIKTFKLNIRDMEPLENKSLCIPIKIETSCQQILNNDFIKQIKLKHDFGDIFTKQENTDFVLESNTKRQFPVHKSILAAHSPVLRELIKHSSSKTIYIDISDRDMELLLQFIYTGTIKDVLQFDCLTLMEIASKFQLKSLFLLAQHATKVNNK